MRQMAQLTPRRGAGQAIGTPILDDGLGVTLVPTDAIDPEQAAADVLASYLRTLTFFVNNRAPQSDPPLPTQQFQFEKVFDEWPEADRELPYPCATVHAAEAPYSHHALVPTPLDGTFGLYDVPGAMRGTVLWKTAELDAAFQVDVWTRDVAKREAVLARMQSAFAPEEGSARVMLTGTPSYWNLPIRASLEPDAIARIDEPEPVYSHERRAIVRVRASVDVVDLRCATLLDVGYRLTLGTGAELEALAAVVAGES
jgi:hypothetical protein